MSKQTHTKPVTVSIEKLSPTQWHWSLQGGYYEDFRCLDNYDQDTVLDAYLNTLLPSPEEV